MSSIKENHFDRGKVFYPYVMQYIFAYHGMIELCSRGMVKEVKRAKKQSCNIEDMYPEVKRFIEAEQVVTPLLVDLAFHSNFMESMISFDIEEIASELLANYDYLFKYTLKSAGILIIMAYESTKRLDDKKSELWNFFYHCRNAAAHGGKFNIKSTRFPAKWGNLEITRSMNGTNLFQIPDEGGLLGPGDPIRLLWEIEQKFI